MSQDFNIADTYGARKQTLQDKYKLEQDQKYADTYDNFNKMLDMYLTDYTADGVLTDDEYAQAADYLNKFALKDEDKAQAQDLLDYYKSSYGEGGTAGNKTTEAAEFEDYKTLYAGNQYSGSSPKIINGTLTVQADGKTMFAGYETSDPNSYNSKYSKRHKEVEQWVNAARNGQLPNGAVMDVVGGVLNKYIMYYNGKFYVLAQNMKDVKIKF
jgi:hypothetical protein